MSLERLVRLEHAVGAGAAGVHHPLGDALVVEVHDLLAEVEVLQQGRAPRAGPQRVVGVVDRHALRRRQDLALLCPTRRAGFLLRWDAALARVTTWDAVALAVPFFRCLLRRLLGGSFFAGTFRAGDARPSRS